MRKQILAPIQGVLLMALIALISFSSCSKENMDDTTIDEDEEEIVIITCDSLQLAMSYDADAETLTVIADGGNEPYTYSWYESEETSATIDASSGEYFLAVVTDAEGCVNEVDYEVDVVDDPCASFSVGMEWIPGVATLNAEVEGGTAPYSYQWSNEASGAEIEIDGNGEYTVTVTDANGCTVAVSTIVDGVDPCLLDHSFDFEESTSLLTVTIYDGTEPFLYEWVSPNGSLTLGETGTIEVGESGNYSVTVTDANGCVIEAVTTVNVDTNPDCDGTFNMNSTITGNLNFDGAGEAYIFSSDCTQGQLTTEYNYLILDADWDFWGSDGANWGFASDGIPGFTFGSNSAPEVGGVYGQYALGVFETLYYNGSGNYYLLDEVQITIAENGTNVGESIAGTISGNVSTFSSDGTIVVAPITGTFCVPIVQICD